MQNSMKPVMELAVKQQNNAHADIATEIVKLMANGMNDCFFGNILPGTRPYLLPCCKTEEYSILMSKCWEQDPNQRPSFQVRISNAKVLKYGRKLCGSFTRWMNSVTQNTLYKNNWPTFRNLTSLSNQYLILKRRKNQIAIAIGHLVNSLVWSKTKEKWT